MIEYKFEIDLKLKGEIIAEEIPCKAEIDIAGSYLSYGYKGSEWDIVKLYVGAVGEVWVTPNEFIKFQMTEELKRSGRRREIDQLWSDYIVEAA